VSHPPEISGTKQLARLGSGWLVVHHGVLAAYRKARGQEFRFVPRPVVPWRADAAIDRPRAQQPSDAEHRHTIAIDVIDGPKQCPDHEDAEQGRPAA